jgi:hypothetical protein
MAEWHVRQAGSRPIGPVSTELVIRGIEAGKVDLTAEVCRVGSRDWMPIDMVDEFAHVAVDEEAATRVTESPWFADQPSSPVAASQPRIAPPPAPKPSSSLGLPRARAPLPSAPRAAPPPPPVRSAPRASQPRQPPIPLPAQNRYGETDDDAMTNVVHSPLDAGAVTYECDDETMTRVAAPRAPAEPLGAAPKKPGLLKTAPMWAADMPDIEPVRPVAAEPSRRLPAPRPAAGAPPESAIEVRADLLAGPVEMPPAPPGFGGPAFPPPQQSFDVARFAPTQPAGTGPAPGGYAPMPAPPQQYGYPPQPSPPQRSADSGVKALIALIALLFLALMTVLILLVLRR